jgi:predicted Fe-S protein YdhL (DUF1289 family)
VRYGLPAPIRQIFGILAANLPPDWAEAPMDSPCVACCKLNNDKICTGCYRHIEEIVDWNKRTDAEHLQILQRCAARRQEIDAQNSPTSAITSVEWQSAKQALALKKQSRLS